MTLEVTDFARSFVRWSIDPDFSDTRVPGHMPWGNHVRILVDARCTITSENGQTSELYLIAPCRKEWMYRDTELIMGPGAEYRAIFSEDRQIDVGMQSRIDGDRPLPLSTSGFRDLAFEAVTQKATLLATDADIVASSMSGRPLVCRTRIECDGRLALLEYPVRTMNYHPERRRFQVDTGPIIFPLLSEWFDHPIDCCRLAHTVFNTLDYAEFTCRPSGTDGAVNTTDLVLRTYRDIVRQTCHHQIFAFA
ncbi:MAG: hypothetical protein AB7V46_11025 [Thermomicrobiales bacterium]